MGDDPDHMEAGHDLDRLVAETIGCKPWFYDGGQGRPFWKCGCGDYRHEMELGPIKNYSTDIAAAWEVAEKVELFKHHFLNTRIGLWTVIPLVCDASKGEDAWRVDWLSAVGLAGTAPLAICRAALKAKFNDH